MSAPGHRDHEFTPCPRCVCGATVGRASYFGHDDRARLCSGDRCQDCPPTFTQRAQPAIKDPA